MRIAIFLTPAALLIAAASAALAQSYPTAFFTPSTLYAGSAATTLNLYAPGAPAGLAARWNGSERTSTADSSGNYKIQLTAQDLASPGLAEVTLADPQTGTPYLTSFIAVAYNVVPNGCVYDRSRNRLYFTTTSQPADARFPANSVVALDPETGRIGPTLALGNYPADLALTDDNASLWVLLDGDGLARRISLDTFTVISEFRFRTDTAVSALSSFSRSSIAVMPGAPESVAIYTHPDTSSSLTRVSLYDSGVKRATDSALSGEFDSLLFAPDGKSLFMGSYANFNSPQNVLRYSVDATGIPKQTPVSFLGGGLVAILDGLLYTSRGTIIDLQTNELVGSLGIGGAVAIDASNRRILATHVVKLANLSDYPEYLHAFDLATQTPLGYQSVDTLNYAAAGASHVQKLLRFGDDGVAFTSNRGLMVFHTPLAAPAPAVESRAVVNAAGQQGGSVAPGEIVTIYGSNLGPAAPVSAQINSSGTFDSSLAHVQVWFDRTPGTVLLAYQGQLNVIAPFGLRAGTSVDLQVWYYGIPSARIPLPVVSAAPALFTRSGTGSGNAAVINQNGSVNAPSPPGSYVTLFGTGGGAVEGAVDGTLARSAKSLGGTPRVLIGGREAQIYYAGAAPQLPAGVFQVNVLVPADTPSGNAALTISVNGLESPKGVTLEIR